MTRVDTGKLVRDGIPAIITTGGGTPVTRVLNDAAFVRALHDKLLEETAELRAAPDLQSQVEEAADVYEVLRSLVEAIGSDWDSVLRAAEDKRDERGGFSSRLWLAAVD